MDSLHSYASSGKSIGRRFVLVTLLIIDVTLILSAFAQGTVALMILSQSWH